MPLTRNDISNNNATEQSFAATNITTKNHTMFPADFVWGTATAAYQIEGAHTKDGRGLSVWDVFSHTPSKTLNGDHGDVAIDFYHRYEQDIAMMASMGIRNFRFSISWTRIFPSGTLPANPKGIEFYNKVIDTLLSHNITPYVTLYHWDTPHELEESMGGWLGREISDHFTTFAEVCFKEFGDRVKHWITINEPLSFVWSGYGSGVFAPGRSSSTNGDTTVEPYVASHNAILAHAHVVHLYRTKFKKQQGGVIGVSLNSDWAEPFSDCAEDLAASQRYMEFNLGWYADPIVHGDYPQSMKDAAGDRLPTFSPEEKELIKGSFDFFGLNHYTSGFVRHKTEEEKQIGELGWVRDMGVHVSREKNGKLIGPKADPIWLYAVPFGMRKILNWIAQRYDNPPVLITENGVAAPGESMMPLDEALADSFRVSYIRDYIEQVGKAIHHDGVNVKGYFVWSFMDNFEWADGYSKRFGITYIDYENGLTRHPKQSAMWYSEFIKEHHYSNRASLTFMGSTDDVVDINNENQNQRRGSFTQVL